VTKTPRAIVDAIETCFRYRFWTMRDRAGPSKTVRGNDPPPFAIFAARITKPRASAPQAG
jgi:hypothetical protein